MTDEAVPFGPEDQRSPDRVRRSRDPKRPAEHERGGREGHTARDDVDAWETEATFGENAVGAPDGGREEDGVDPIVHRGE